MLELVLEYPVIVMFFHMLTEECGIPRIITSSTLLFYLGFNAKLDIGLVVSIIASVTLASILGSTFLYIISRKYGRHLLLKYQHVLKHVNITSTTIKQLEIAMSNHGIWFLVIARFTPGARVLGTIAAGIFKMPYPKFIATVIPTTIIWSTIYISAGYFLSDNMYRFGYDLLNNKLLLMALFIAVVLLFIFLIRHARGILFPPIPDENLNQET